MLDFADPLVRVTFPAVRLVLEADGSARWVEAGWEAEDGPFGWLAAFPSEARPAVRGAFDEARRVSGARVAVRARRRGVSQPWLGAFVNALEHPDIGAVLLRHDVRIGTGFRDLVERSSMAAFELDVEGNFVAVDERFGELTGYPGGLVLGKQAEDLIDAADVPLVQEAWTATRVHGESPPLEFRLARPDGATTWVVCRIVGVHDPGGEQAGFLGVLEDVTERRLAEEALRRSEERLRSVLANSLDIVIVLDEEARFSYISPPAEHLLGYRISEWMGRSVFDLVHPDDLARVAESVMTTRTTPGGRGAIELRVRHADGTWREVETLSNNLLDDPVVRGVIVSVRDLSERRRVQASLRDAESRFREVFENAAVGICTIAHDGRYTRVNRALCEMLGYSLPELLTKNAVDLIHPGDLELSLESWDRLVRGEIDRYTVERRMLRGDGGWLWTRVSSTVVRDESGAPSYTVAQVEDITAQRRLEQQLEHDATHDRLTGLTNHALLLSHLERALAHLRRSGLAVGVLFVDLDHFKQVNDSLGHAAGDQVLVAVGERLRDVIRAGDVPARLGGDEFVVLCPELHGVEDAVDVAERIVAALRQPFDAGGSPAYVGGSVGIALAREGDAIDAAALLAQADAAAYRAKELGRDRLEVFDEGLRRRVERRRRVEAAIRESLDRDELPLECAPMVHLETRQVHGFVVEVAWKKLAPGLRSTDEGRRLLDDSGLAPAVGRAALARLGARLREWAAACPGGAPRALLRVPDRHLTSGELVADVRRVVEVAGDAVGGLCLGVAEDALAIDPDDSLDALAALRDLGVALAIEDFGRGHSSLNVLRRLPVQSVVLDELFVQELGDDPESAAVVSAVIGLAHALGLRTIASGIRSREQLTRLVELGCGYGYGPLLGGGVAPEDALLLLTQPAA